MRSFANFSAHDFEFFIADLFGAIDEVRYEVFARGADGGIDLRHIPGPGEPPDVIQCKRYVKSSYGDLKTAAKKEAKVLAKGREPRSYRLVTSLELSPANKDELAGILAGYVEGPQDISGAGDLETMLDENELVERRHPKLWLSGGVQLQTVINNGTFERSKQLLEETKDLLKRYVETAAFGVARQRLREDKVLIIAGPPGIGKTTLAQMLLADAALDGYEAIEISADVEEGWDMLSDEHPQAFYYDDFLGTTFLQTAQVKNEDKRIAQLIRKAAGSEGRRLFVMTTREHILKQALGGSEVLRRERVEARRYMLELKNYSRLDRARIFYNHIWESGELDQRARQDLIAERGYLRVIDHPNYTPRLIEHITGLGSQELGEDDLEHYLNFAVGVLNDPRRIWRHAFEEQLGAPERGMLLALASLQGEVAIDDLETAFRSYCEAAAIELRGPLFKRTLRVLRDSFLTIAGDRSPNMIKPANPSIVDFVAAWLRESPDEVRYLLEGASFFIQLAWFESSVLTELSAPHAEEALPRLAAAIERLLGSPSAHWNLALTVDGLLLTRAEFNSEARLAFAAGAIGEHPALGEALGEWLQAQVREMGEKLGAGEGFTNLRGPVELVGAMAKAELLEDRVRGQVKDYVLENLHSAEEWGQLLRLRELLPDLFDLEEWVAHQNKFHDFAEGALDGNVDLSEEVDELEELADEFGVSLDEGHIEILREEFEREAEEAAGERMREIAEADDDEGEPFNPPVDEDAQVEAIFSDLVDVEE